MTNEQPNSDQAGTWEIDWDKIYHASDPDDNYVMGGSIAVAAVREYRRQQAAQGRAEVRRDDLETILDAYEDLLAEGFDVADGGQAAKRLYAALAAATEQR